MTPQGNSWCHALAKTDNEATESEDLGGDGGFAEGFLVAENNWHLFVCFLLSHFLRMPLIGQDQLKYGVSVGSASKGTEGGKEKRMSSGAKQRALDTAGHIQFHTLLPKHSPYAKHGPYAKAPAIQNGWYPPRSAFLCSFSETSTAALGLATWVANTVPEKNLFFWFSKEIKKFPSSSHRPWCQTVWVSAKLLQTLSRSSVNLNYGGSAFPGSIYSAEAKAVSICQGCSGHKTQHHTAERQANGPCQTAPASLCKAGFEGFYFKTWVFVQFAFFQRW